MYYVRLGCDWGLYYVGLGCDWGLYYIQLCCWLLCYLQALLDTALTRVVLPMPILLLPPFIMAMLER